MMNQTETTVRQLHHLNEQRLFTHEEALELLPLLIIITTRTKKELNNLNAQLAYFKNSPEKTNMIQDRINGSIQTWTEKIRRLGAIPVSLCKVKIPGQGNQYFWEYPEPKLFLS